MIRCTIAIPVYNRKNKTLNHIALESALAQKAQGLEILVVDDCSTDGTWEALQKYSDPRLKLIRNEKNVGLFGNFNRCLELAQGKYFRLLCSDDQLVLGCLEEEIALMEAHENVVLLSTYGRRIDEEGKFIGPLADHFPAGIYSGRNAILNYLWFQSHYAINPFNYPSGVLIRREAALKAGCFDASMHMSGDVDFFLRVLEHGDLEVTEKIGCDITIHTDQQGVHLTGDIAIIKEIILLAERYKEILEEAGCYKRIHQQLAAYALGLAYKYWRMGLKESALEHKALALGLGVSFRKIATGVARILTLRLMMKIVCKQILPGTQYRKSS